MTRPIPPRLLPHSASVEQPDSSGRYGDAYASPVSIPRVRYQPRSSVESGAWAEDAPQGGTLYIDARTSGVEAGAVPEAGARVTVTGPGCGDGIVAHATSVAPFVGLDGRAHHWEVGLR